MAAAAAGGGGGGGGGDEGANTKPDSSSLDSRFNIQYNEQVGYWEMKAKLTTSEMEMMKDFAQTVLSSPLSLEGGRTSRATHTYGPIRKPDPGLYREFSQLYQAVNGRVRSMTDPGVLAFVQKWRLKPWKLHQLKQEYEDQHPDSKTETARRRFICSYCRREFVTDAKRGHHETNRCTSPLNPSSTAHAKQRIRELDEDIIQKGKEMGELLDSIQHAEADKLTNLTHRYMTHKSALAELQDLRSKYESKVNQSQIRDTRSNSSASPSLPSAAAALPQQTAIQDGK